MWGLRPLCRVARGPGWRAWSSAPGAVVDVAIAGGGLVGAAFAAALAANPLTSSLSVVLLDPHPPAALPRELPPIPSSHVAALNPASVALLRSVGAWRALAPAAAPFCDMQVWGSGGGGYVRCDAASVGADVMGYVVEERLAVAALHQRLRGGTAVQLRMPCAAQAAELPPYSPAAQLSGGPLVRLELQGGASLQTRLLVGADGHDSAVRQWAQIRTLPRRSGAGRRAMLAAIVSTAWTTSGAFQRFLPTGPLALLPAPGGGHSVLLWSCPAEMAAQLAALPRAELAAAATDALTGPPQPASPLADLLGGLLAAPRTTQFTQPPAVTDVLGAAPRVVPLASTQAGRYVRPRLALLGDAAHGGAPLALGQGANLGLADARALAGAIAAAVEAGQDFGSAAWLERHYESRQRRVNDAAVGAMDSLRALFATQSGPLVGLRSVGLDLINATPVAKTALLRLAMQGLGGDER